METTVGKVTIKLILTAGHQFNYTPLEKPPRKEEGGVGCRDRGGRRRRGETRRRREVTAECAALLGGRLHGDALLDSRAFT